MAWTLPFSLSDLARRMAEMNIAPEQLQPAVQQSQQLGQMAQAGGGSGGGLFDAMPTNESFPNARQQLNHPDTGPNSGAGMLDNIFKSLFGGAQQVGSDLMQPIPTNNSFQPQSQHLGSLAPAGGGPMQGPPMSAMGAPMQGPPMSAMLNTQQQMSQMQQEAPSLGTLMQPNAQTGQAVQIPGDIQTTPTGPKDLQGGTPFEEFMNTVRASGVTNPNALSAIAATGQRESGWDQKKIAGTWSDPSVSGAPGTSGGAMSWRGPRYQHMLDFAQTNGLDPKSARTQALFFVSEDPQLMSKLDAAQSPQEAQALMNNAWAFAGYQDPNNPETKARFQEANKYAGMFSGAGMAGSSGSWTELANRVESVGGSDAAGATVGADVAGTGVTGPTGTETTKKLGFGARLGELGKAIKAPPPAEKNKPPAGTAPLPQSGQYRPDPQQLQLLLQMLGQGGVGVPQVAPTLGQLLGGGGRR